MGALPALVSVEEYLHTDYEPDCEYVRLVTAPFGRGSVRLPARRMEHAVTALTEPRL